MRELPVPAHFEPSRVGEVWRVPYEDRAREAPASADEHGLAPAADDSFRLGLIAVDVQNTFCIPEFELFVAGRSGTGAVDDNRRLCEFVYRNLGTITQIFPSLDTHHAMQVFHAIWLVDEHGDHPAPYTLVSAEDVKAGRWRMNTAVEEAVFFHSIARHSQPDFQVKGNSPLSEHYSMLGPEVTEGPDGDRLGGKNTELIEKLLTFDVVVVAGQAKSHCMAWTIDDLLEEEAAGERLAERTYLLEDCTSAVVVPGLVDYTDEADGAFERYAAAGMHVVRSVDPIESWPGLAPAP